jgi:cytochrome P450
VRINRIYHVKCVLILEIKKAEGEDWQRHRRITAPTFNEKTSSLVWKEARRQAMDMLLAWIEMGSAGTKNTVEDTTKLAMHVLTSAGFGIFYSFRGDAQLPSGHTMAFGDALSLIIRNFAYVMMFSSKQLTSPIMPRKLQKIGQAIKEFKRYSREMLENERERISNHKPGESNLMTVLARANIQDAHHTALRLSDDEAYGNIFIYALGGHETTASALSYALVLLAANPECQDWLVEEINQVFGNNNESSKEPTYEELFPQLKRCLAVMVRPIYFKGKRDSDIDSTKPCAFIGL